MRSVGLILSGSVHVIHEDFWGRKDILAQLGPAELFAESFSLRQRGQAPRERTGHGNDRLYADRLPEDYPYLHIRLRVPYAAGGKYAADHRAQNIRLMQKMEQISKRTTRDKLLAYLSAESQKAGRGEFDIPFNRQELADYLSVDRSAMSSELGRMRDEGLLDYARNHFTLKQV